MKWEYFVIGRGKLNDATLNHLGDKGWELVSVVVVSTISGDEQQAIFKRPKVEP